MRRFLFFFKQKNNRVKFSYQINFTALEELKGHYKYTKNEFESKQELNQFMNQKTNQIWKCVLIPHLILFKTKLNLLKLNALCLLRQWQILKQVRKKLASSDSYAGGELKKGFLF